MKLGDLLQSKELKYRVPVTVRQDENIVAAIRNLTEYDRGSLIVVDNKGDFVGIITERDIVRKCIVHNKDCSKIKVRDVMSTNVIFGTQEDDSSYAISVMKEHRIRHLPVVKDKKPIGMISMRDLLGEQLEECSTQARFLSDYISASYGQS